MEIDPLQEALLNGSAGPVPGPQAAEFAPDSLRPPLRVVVKGGTWAQGLAGFFFARRVVESGIGTASHPGWLPGIQIAPTLEVPTLQRVSNRSFTQLAPMVSRPDKRGIQGP